MYYRKRLGYVLISELSVFSKQDDEGEPLFPLLIPTAVLTTKQNIDTKSTYEEIDIPPTLTVEQVKDKWEDIKRRIKSKKDGTMISAILNAYTIVGIEGTKNLPVIVIKASAKFHYDTLQKADRSKVIEWAMSLELNQECLVRLLPPGKSDVELQIPLPPATHILNSASDLLPSITSHSSKTTSSKTTRNNEDEYDI